MGQRNTTTTKQERAQMAKFEEKVISETQTKRMVYRKGAGDLVVRKLTDGKWVTIKKTTNFNAARLAFESN
jgi:hypothetical protein